MRVRKNTYYKRKGAQGLSLSSPDYVVKVVFIRNYQCVSERVNENKTPRLAVWQIKKFIKCFEPVPELKSKLLYEESKKV